MRSGRIRIGISGWEYGGWRGNFYPAGLRQADRLSYAAREFETIELNGTFYSLQRPDSFARWRDETPAGFVFAIKGSRFITHMKRLKDAEGPLANFLASGVLRLEERLGPFLWQLSPRLRFDGDRLDRFFALLPRTGEAAAELARHHDGRLAGRAWTRVEKSRPLRHAVEPRHESFCREEFVSLLRRHGIALVVSDAPGWRQGEDLTADFVYARLHGAEELYASGYDGRALDGWAERLRLWAKGGSAADARLFAPHLPPPRRRSRDVYLYFDNDAKARAPVDARALKRRLEAAR